MAVIAFDTSALVRRYDRREPGAERVRALCVAAAGNTLLIARITPLEIASALTRKGREGVLDAAMRDRIWRLFQRHRRDQYRVIEATEMIYRRAEYLLFAQPLRAYDALLLATALVAHDTLQGLSPDFRFCTGDRAQASAAAAAGLVVEMIM